MQKRICRCGRKLYEDVHQCPSCGQPMDDQPIWSFFTLECTQCGKAPVETGLLRFSHQPGDSCPCDCPGKLFRPETPRYENT